MKIPASRLQGLILRSFPVVVMLAAAYVQAAFLAGCGGSGGMLSTPGGPVPGEKTNVVVVMTSTANDKLVSFDISIQTMSLTDKSGNTVMLYMNSQSGPNSVTEFLHLSGASEPLATASVPQGVYTSATVTTAGCDFSYDTFTATGLLSATDAEGLCGQGTGTTTVNLPSPITISGSVAALALDLQVPQSFTLTINNNAPDTYTISPTFTLAPFAVSAQPTNDQNGKINGVAAMVTSIDAMSNSVMLKTISGISIQAKTNASTAFEGISGFSSLVAGMLMNIDTAIQSDGSLLATRIEVDDTQAPAVLIGTWLNPLAQPGQFGLQIFDCFLAPGNPACDVIVDTSASTFNVSGQVSNLQSLPFTPNFSGATIFLGQNVANYTLGARTNQGVPISTTTTLEPQTIDGTVMSVSNTNGFSAYTVVLAPYDLIPTLQAFLGAQANLNQPNTVLVYADSTVQFLNSGTIEAGSVLRFHGLIFNDNGTLRMDCISVSDGVPE